ncbi:MAG: tetratricopeptide repeat protein [Spirochaetaceae bacterium]|jgi:hypothetical protein|nr:tetratricopeptide repeat protein [Spirochaetaceae bacterium]
MPSLEDLEAFQTSFRSAGREDIILAEQGLLPEDIPLPDSDAPKAFAETGPIPDPVEDFLQGPAPEVAEDSADSDWDGEDDFDFSDLWSPDVPQDPIPETPAAEEGEEGEENVLPEAEDTPPPEEFSFDDLGNALNGDTETPDTSAEEYPATLAEADAIPPVEDFPFDDQGNVLNTDAETPDTDTEEDTALSSGDLPPLEDFSFDDLENALNEDMETPDTDAEEDAAASAEADAIPPVEDFPFNDLENALNGDTETPDTDIEEDAALSSGDLPPLEDFSFDDLENALNEDNLDDEDETAEGGLPPLEDFSFDDLENALNEDTETPDAGAQEEITEEEEESLGDVSFDDLENILREDPPEEEGPEQGASASLEESALQETENASPRGEPSVEGLPLDTFDAYKVQEEAPDDAPLGTFRPFDEDLAAIKPTKDIEEIELSEEELASLNKTLESYPLNLRIACEEAIAEQAVDPALMSKLIKSLVKGASVKEMTPLVGKILGRIIIIPKNFQKKTGEALEAAHSSFTYIFIHKFLPILRLFLMIALVVASLGYLAYRFVYTPIRANSVYKKGYAELLAGEYSQAKEVFKEALRIQPQKPWFYRYAEGFRDARQYGFAEEKYDELLQYYLRDKKGVLDYAAMETNHLSNYAKADRLLRRNILDYAADDKEGLLAVGDNALAWGDIEPERYEDARNVYARYLERYGWVDPVVERMLKYFIRTDNLKEVLPLQSHFMDNPRTKIAPATLAELGGYLLDKKLEEVRGVPNEYISYIDGIRDILVKAAGADPALPEPHYHLARYYNYFDNVADERITLERALQSFDAVQEEPVRRLNMRIDTERRYARLLTNEKEFFAAEEHLVKAVSLFEDGVKRQILTSSPRFGQLYADLGDLAYFTQEGIMGRALEYYLQSEENGWAPPEVHYRMGYAYYHQRQWGPALERFFVASSEIPLNRRLLNALGSASYMRGDYFTAQGYYSRLMELLDADRLRFPLLLPNERPDHLELTERLMIVRNNLGVTLDALTEQTGDNRYRSQALGLYSESARAWDTLTRNPETMVRSGAGELSTPGLNLAFLNSRNSLHPEPDYEPQIYIQIDKDVLEPSPWETLAPQSFRLSDGLF